MVLIVNAICNKDINVIVIGDLMPKIQESANRLSITIPSSIAKLKGWKKGTNLEFRERNGYICLIEE
jgi:hypothetical protein